MPPPKYIESPEWRLQDVNTDRPDWLERFVDAITISHSMSKDDLLSTYKGYRPASKPESTLAYNREEFPEMPEAYFYFEPEENSRYIPVDYSGDIFVPLNPELYGFDSNDKTKLNPHTMNIPLSESVKKQYLELITKKEIDIPTLLETAGYLVNESMDYDFEAMEGSSGIDWVALKKNFRKREDPVLKGVCHNAGDYIIQLLTSLGIEDRYKFVHTKAYSEDYISTSHITTTFFDTQTGKWAVINSISPSKDYNLTPEDKLQELGQPYKDVDFKDLPPKSEEEKKKLDDSVNALLKKIHNKKQ